MFTLNKKPTITRAIRPTDTPDLIHMINMAWRVFIRIPAAELPSRIKTLAGFLAEDHLGLRGFILYQAQRNKIAVIIAATLRDTWGVQPYLDLLLPPVEQESQNRGLGGLAYVGQENWLSEALAQRQFRRREWIVTYERTTASSPPAPPSPATIRTAHYKDLPTLLALDTQIFADIWHKSVEDFNQALINADTFLVAEIDNRIVGYAWCELHRRHAHLTRLAVHPERQGEGIGAQLLHQVIITMLAKNVDQITLNTQESNTRSRTLYKRFGFVDVGQRMPLLWKTL